jgi:hypothetical protein
MYVRIFLVTVLTMRQNLISFKKFAAKALYFNGVLNMLISSAQPVLADV